MMRAGRYFLKLCFYWLFKDFGVARHGLPNDPSAVVTHQSALVTAFAAVAEEIRHLAGIFVSELELRAAPADIAARKDGSILALDSAHDELRNRTRCRHS